MKTTLFYFSGLAADLPTELLSHATNQLTEQNRKTAALVFGPLHTIEHLTRAAKINVGGAFDFKNKERVSSHVRQIIMRGNL